MHGHLYDQILRMVNQSSMHGSIMTMRLGDVRVHEEQRRIRKCMKLFSLYTIHSLELKQHRNEVLSYCPIDDTFLRQCSNDIQ